MTASKDLGRRAQILQHLSVILTIYQRFTNVSKARTLTVKGRSERKENSCDPDTKFYNPSGVLNTLIDFGRKVAEHSSLGQGIALPRCNSYHGFLQRNLAEEY